MEEKFKVVVGILSGIIILIVGFLLTTPLRANLTRKNDIINFFNRKSIHNISQETIKEYKKLSGINVIRDYNVTPIISDYISKIESAVNYLEKRGEEAKYDLINGITSRKDYMDSDIKYDYLGDELSPIMVGISEELIYGEFELNIFSVRDYVIKSLEKVLYHDPNENYVNGWYVPKEFIQKELEKEQKQKESESKPKAIEPMEIKLPFDCRLSFTPTDVEAINDTFVDCKISKYQEEYKVTLMKQDNSTVTTYFTFDNRGWFHKWDMKINIDGILFKNNVSQALLYSEWGIN